ncbi:MAG: PD-(D/E)XK nuclease family protein [Candidatus Aminicenantes bacterium]|jgi:RecB family exonuclease
MGFLEKVAGKFLEEYGNEIHQIVFVFPTRRARLYFLRWLKIQKPANIGIWAPLVFSINDFIAQLSGLTISDQLDLIFKLYAVYKEHIRSYPKEFEDFYPWGKMIISDFDEIDKYLIDSEELFRTLKEFKAIEDITRAEKSGIYNRYTGFWADMGVLYREFNRLLRTDNKAYEGMAYREVAEKIKKGQPLEGVMGEKVVFCGFNALTKAEETIISYFLEKEQAETYWDMDRYFVEDRNQEAGHFFRKNRESLGLSQPNWLDEELAGPKDITIIGVQSKVSQAKVLGIKLRELRDYLTDPASTAVVLPDETVLFPVLNSLPAEVKEVNVTIGFPLQQTPVFSLFDSILQMQLRAMDTKEGYYYKDIQNLLNHPYLKLLASDEITKFITSIKEENRVYIKGEDISFPVEALNNLFKIRGDSGQFMDFFLELLDTIRRFYEENEPDLFSVDYEYMYHFYTLISRLKDSLKSTGLVLEARTFRQLLTDIVQGTRIPFTGEPLVGLQIMGVLETQTLDFNHLFLLSVNEGFLPPGKTQQSFIPFDVRAFVGLPTYKERDAIAAYHFYRLLKSSKNITIVYITEARGIEKSEKSRFIDQILIEYAEKNPKANIQHQVIDFSFDTQKVKEISIQKSEKMIKSLMDKSYSASSLLTYLSCSLEFYFTYILKLKEEEEVYESPDYRLIGEIIHKTLQELYKPYEGKDRVVSFQEIEKIKDNIEEKLLKTFKEKLKTGDVHTGRNRIAYEVMKKLLENFFEKEKQNSGFKVLMLERKVQGVDFRFSLNEKEHQVELEGTIDRLDVQDGIYRVIDYKTGKIGSLNLKSAEEFSEKLSGQEAVNRREAFQLFFYQYLLRKTQKYDGDYRLGIYPFKKLYDDLKFIKIDKSDMIGEELMVQFEGILSGIFQDLFNLEVPFIQTEEEKNCQYCPYQSICSREIGKSYSS